MVENFEGVRELLQKRKDLVFVLASQSLNQMSKIVTEDLELSSRFMHIGWVNTKVTVHILDLYFDSYPRGSCNTIFEGYRRTTYCLTETELNLDPRL